MLGARQRTLALPAEVWLKIAEHMEIDEWARASGTCKATWQLQLDVVHIGGADYLPETGVPWVLKRARQARQLVFGPFDNERQHDAAALSIYQAQCTWTFLKTLSFNDFIFEGCETGEGYAMLMWVLGKASTLEYLRLDCAYLRPLPSICNLKHLQVMSHYDGCDISSCLSTLDSLETLSLSSRDIEGLQGSNLCLRGLRKLHSLLLDNVVPETLILAECTALHVRVYELGDANEDVWASHASQMRSFCVSTDTDIYATDNLPDFLLNSGMSGLKSLTLNAKSIGREQAPFCLRGAFLQVQLLHLQTIERMHLDIPGGLFPWHSVYIFSESVLSIKLQSVPDFADSCQVFSFGYVNMQGVDLVRVCSHMTAQGRPWAHAAGNRCSYLHSPSVPLFPDICGDVGSMWALLEDRQLGPDGLLPRTF